MSEYNVWITQRYIVRVDAANSGEAYLLAEEKIKEKPLAWVIEKHIEVEECQSKS